MSGVIERILRTKVAAADLERTLEAINALPPEDHTDIAARVICLIELFGEPGRHEVSLRVAAIDWRFQALAQLAGRPEFKNWSLPPRWCGLDRGDGVGGGRDRASDRNRRPAGFRSGQFLPTAAGDNGGRRSWLTPSSPRP